jgi:hypothetical protein
VPLGLWQGTNLSSDSGISVEELPAKENCSAHAFIDPLSKVKDRPFTDMGVQYFVASSSGAGAGNIYEEIVYVLPYSNPCVGIRYFIHSTNIGNYPPGSVEEYNRKQLLSEFDKIRESLVLGR